MKKLKLDLDQIQVFSFAVETTESGSGTVNGFSTTFNTIYIGGCAGTNDSCDSCFPHDCPVMPISWDTNC